MYLFELGQQYNQHFYNIFYSIRTLHRHITFVLSLCFCFLFYRLGSCCLVNLNMNHFACIFLLSYTIFFFWSKEQWDELNSNNYSTTLPLCVFFRVVCVWLQDRDYFIPGGKSIYSINWPVKLARCNLVLVN